MSKSFVSLSFADSKKLQVVQLNRNKDKVEKHITIDLPDGLIIKHNISNSESLAKILKGVWQRLKLREKSVGIIVPEFSTYIKTLNIPKLTSTELDEAVRWQSQEYLPIDINDVSLDWRIIGKDENTTTVLVVCINKNILSSYVQSAAKAGLYPIIVETPSIALARMNTGDAGKLMIYKMTMEAVMLVTKGEEIFGSSATDINDFSGIAGLSKRMINHYENAAVSGIVVGGFEFDSKLEELLEKETNRSVDLIKIDIGGLTQPKLQEYLIPISLQFKEPSIPSDPTTINLLPTELVKYYTFEKLRSQCWSLSFIASIAIWSIFVAVAAAYLFIINQLNSFKRENIAKGNIIEEKKQVVDKIAASNALFDKILKISSSSMVSGKMVNEIYSAKPDGVSISEYKIFFENGVVELAGISQDRISLIDFKQNLEKNERISDLEIPISSFEIVSNLDFTVKFIYDVGIIKKQPVKSGPVNTNDF